MQLDMIYGGDSFRNLLHLMYGPSYHSIDVDSVYNMHSNGDWSAHGNDLHTYRNAMFWHDFWEFSGKRFLFLIAVSYDFFKTIANKTDEIKYTNNDNPKAKIPQMIRNYNENIEAIINLLKRYPNA